MSEARTRRGPRAESAPPLPETITPPPLETSDISPIALAAAEAAVPPPVVEHIAEQTSQVAAQVSEQAVQVTEQLAQSTEQASEAVAEGSAWASKAAEAAGRNLFSLGNDAMSAFAASQAAFVRGLEAMATEVAGLAHSGFAAVADSATAMLGAKTLADAIEVQAGLARRSVDAAFDSSAKLSEIGVRLTTEASQPLISRFGETWKITRLG